MAATSLLSQAIQGEQAIVSIAGLAGIAGFRFHIDDESVVTLESEITDHYVEDGTAVQDHIVNRPKRVSLSGYIGEVPYYDNINNSILTQAVTKLAIVGSYLPTISATVEKLYAKAKTVNDLASADFATQVGAATDIWTLYKNINIPKTKQAEAFLYFEALRDLRIAFTIETPYRFYSNMVIETLKATQDRDTKDMSNFTVTFKEFRTVQTKYQTNPAATTQGRLQSQAATVANKGISKGTDTLVSGAVQLGNMLRSALQ